MGKRGVDARALHRDVHEQLVALLRTEVHADLSITGLTPIAARTRSRNTGGARIGG